MTAGYDEHIGGTMRLPTILGGICLLLVLAQAAHAADVELQPLSAQAARISETLEQLGSALRADDRAALDRAAKGNSSAESVAEIQRILDRRALVVVSINPESRVKVERGPAAPELVEQGWRTFLVKVINDAGVT